jgi:glyoxylase-like metal-dependent hydrolase (beta-lactamase superfamily II)
MRTKPLIGLAGAAMLTLPAFGQQDFSSVQIETIPVADNLYMLVGSGGNIALSTGADGAFIVDTQFAPLSEKIQAAVTAAGGGDVEFVFNTHHHGDHMGGNAEFANAGATIMAQDNVQIRLSSPQVSTMDGSTTPPAPAAAIPVLTYPTRMTFHWNGNTINLIHAPNAHTDGDSIVHFTNLNAFHMGDTFVNGGFPFVDVNSEGSLDGIINAAQMVLARSNAETRIIPGHGELASPDDLRTFLDMLLTVRERLQSLFDQGMSEDEVVAAAPTAEYDADWGGGFMTGENFTRFAYRTLSN